MSDHIVNLTEIRPDICLQERRYPEAPVTLVQFSAVLLSVVFRALKPFTLGRSTVTQKQSRND